MVRFAIRPAVVDDSEALHQLTQSLLVYLVQGEELPKSLLAGFSRAAFKERLSPGSGYNSFVIHTTSEVAGFISMRGDDYLYHLFVAAKFHRQGVAGQLWRHVTSRSRVEVINLRSSLFAVPIYQKLGFEVSGAEVALDTLQFQPMKWCRASSV